MPHTPIPLAAASAAEAPAAETSAEAAAGGSKRRPRTVDALLAELCRTLARRTGIDCLDDDVQARIVADVARSSLASERMAAHVLQMSSDDRMAWAVGQLSAALTRAGYYDDADALEDYDRRIQFGLVSRGDDVAWAWAKARAVVVHSAALLARQRAIRPVGRAAQAVCALKGAALAAGRAWRRNACQCP
ncbi:hypothetical protein BC831DRAFT_450025, partial [Entophlyctis helioformis]